MGTPDIGAIAKIGCQLIELQLTLVSEQAEDVIEDLWVLGYFFGVFDAMGRRAKLEKYTDGFNLITIGFFNLMHGPEQGAVPLRLALDSHANLRFLDGNMTGGTDVFGWLSEQKTPPMQLVKYLNASS